MAFKIQMFELFEFYSTVTVLDVLGVKAFFKNKLKCKKLFVL